MFSFDFKTGDVGEFLKNFKELSKTQQIALLKNSTFNAQQKQLLATSAGLTITESGQIAATAELAASQTAATASTAELSATMTGLGVSIKSALIALATNPLTYLAVGAIAAGIALHNYITEFDNAMKKAEESQSAYTSTSSELESLKSEAKSYKEALTSLADTYEIKLTGDEEISDLISKLQSEDLSLNDQAEVERIKSASPELKRQIGLKEQVASEQSSQAVSDAIDALKIEHTQDLTQSYTTYDRNGIVGHEQNMQTDIITATQNEITALSELKKKRQKLFNDNIDDSMQTSDFEALDADIERYTDSISTNIESLSVLRKNFMENGVMKSGLSKEAQEYYKAITKSIDDFNTIDLSPEEKHLSQIESFFDGSNVSNSLKDSITQMLKSGEVDNATDALHKLGVTLNDLGIEGKGKKAAFDNYFDGLISSAKEADDTVNGIDGSLEGVKAAFASENQDSDWNSMSDYLKQAQELYENGKIGTDDFKAAAQFISPDLIDPKSTDDADAYAAAWEAAYDKIQRYFNSENPSQSADNFKNDLVEKNLATKNGDDITWNFKNSAEAAEALGISIDAAETAMHNLESYGEKFDGIVFSGEGLSRYESALEKIKSLRDSTNNKDSKDRLNGLIDNWDSELERYQNDLSALTEDQVLHIEFEYEMAQLQSEIDELQGLANEGDNTAKAALNYKKSEYREKREEENQYDESKDASYANSYEAVEALQDQLQNTDGEENRAEIQDQISAIYDLQNAFQDALADGEAVDWESFLGTDNARKFIDEIMEITGMSKDAIGDMLGVDSDLFSDQNHIYLTYEIDTSEVEARMENLATGSTIQFNANVDNAETTITALKNEDGTITYTADVNGAKETVYAIDNKDGTITYTINEVEGVKIDKDDRAINTTVNEVEGTKVNKDSESATQVVNQLLGTRVSTKAPDATQTVNRILGSNVGTMLLPATQIINRYFIEHEASGTLLAPARADGTAYNMLNLKPAYAGGKVALSKAETALVNELGTESLIRNGVWSLLPGKMHIQSLKKGDIILNARQTRDLINSGKTNSYARAYAGGTLLNSYADGLPLLSGSTNKSSYSSGLNKASSSAALSASSTAAAISGAAEDLKDFVEIYLDVASDLTKKQIDAIDRAVGLANKQKESAKAISDVQTEISRNQQAYSQYMQQANSIGLSEAYASQIRSGSLNIENITDETLSKNIKSYEEWYKKAKECQDKITDLQDQERELAAERLEHIEDFYKLVTDVREALQKANDAKLDFSDAMGYSAVSDAVRKTYQESLKAAEEIYTDLSQQLVDFKNEFNDLVSKGYIKKYSDEWYEGQAKIHEFNEAISDAGVSVIEFEDKIRDVTYTKIQYLIDGFERAVDKLDARIDLMEARDETIPESIYQKQLDANNSHIADNKKMRDAKLSEQTLYAVNSERYQKLADEISKLDKETLGLMEDNEKLKDTIFELRFTPLEDGIDKMESLRSELKDFMGLLDKEAYFDREGRITEEGAAALALLGQSMASAKQEIADYREGLDKLQESFDNGVISETEFNKKSEEYRKGIRDAIDDVQDYSESLTDLYLKQMKQENEHLQEIIDKRKDALKAKEAYYDYDKKLRSQSRDVNMLKAQIAALEGVNNAGAQAELKRLKQELSDAEDDLAETKRDHASDMLEDGYLAMSDELDEILENTEYQIVHNADKQQEVIRHMLQNVVDLYSSAYGKINEIIHNTGWAGSPDFNSGQFLFNSEI